MLVSIKIILLAGGQASRYNNLSRQLPTNLQRDKLLSKRGNRYLIEFIVSELHSLGDIIIVTRGEQRKEHYSKLLAHELQNNSIQVIEEGFKNPIGPIGGINSALRICDSSQMVLILPTDLPNVTRDAIRSFTHKAMDAKNFDLVSLVLPNGQVENLILAGHADKIMELSETLIQAKIYRVSSLFRLAQKKRFLNSSSLIKGVNGKETFSDLDSHNSTPEFKTGINEEKFTKTQRIIQNIDFRFKDLSDENHSDPAFFFQQYLNWKINCNEKISTTKSAAIITALLNESNIYRSEGLLSLSLHCLLDAYKVASDGSYLDHFTNISGQISELKKILGE
jgi:molybdopterin-guanine dinucleotide biosynthesis protein A